MTDALIGDAPRRPVRADQTAGPHEILAACPLCGNARGQEDFRPLPRFQRDHIVECRRCAFRFSRVVPSAEDYARVYGAYDYAAEDAARTDINIAAEHALAAQLLPYRSTGRVLDVAAGAGRFLQAFHELGFECYATEFDEKMQAYLTRKGFTVLDGGLFPETDLQGGFDIIIFTEIIEHINIPVPVLDRLFALLRPGGCLFLTTPNFSSLERHLLGSDWGMICWPEHITYWTPRHIDRVLRERGFRRKWLRVENLSPFRIIQALKKGRLGGLLSTVSEQAISDAAQRSVARNPLLSGLKKLINAGLQATRLGSSIGALYVKPGR